jgi:tetratricopeptide (TPR) repeat protein
MHYSTMGMNELGKENYTTAINFFQQAVLIDDQFAVAWNNVGLCCRKIGEYDKALAAYNKSLEIDPKGLMPLQNIAIVYQYQKEYGKAIEAFKKIAAIDPDNPEIYYGIGNIYTNSLNEEAKGLDNLCKAYNLYTKRNSPYIADAEKMIQSVYLSMKKQRKLHQFNEILKQNNITPM